MPEHQSLDPIIHPSPNSLRKKTDAILRLLLDKVAWLVFTLGTLATAVSIMRAHTQGWHLNIILDIFAFICILALLLLRKRLPLVTVASILFILAGMNALGNFVTLGLGTIGFVMFTTCCVLIVLFFTFRAAMWFLGMRVLAVGCVGMLIQFDVIHPLENLNAYLNSTQTWITQITAYIVFVVIMLVSVNVIKTQLWQTSLALRKQADELRESETKYRLLAENMRDVIFVQDMNLNITYFSPSAEQLFGYSSRELAKLKLEDIFTESSYKKAVDTFKQHAKQPRSRAFEIPLLEFEYVKKDGSTFWCEMRPAFLRDEKGNLIGIQSLLRNITERKKVEERIKKDLMEKEILIKEIHHRVKNNLNVVISLLSLQAGQIKSKEQALKAFQDSINRIYVMALVHEQLYHTDDLTRIAMKPYIEAMIKELLQTHGMTETVSPNLQIDRLYMDINTAIPCGLILNEVVTNAMKYAFKEGQEGQLTIKFRLDNKTQQYHLDLRDNGPGLPKGYDTKQLKTLGFQLIQILVKQVHGHCEIHGKKGTHYKISFPKA